MEHFLLGKNKQTKKEEKAVFCSDKPLSLQIDHAPYSKQLLPLSLPGLAQRPSINQMR